MSDSAFRDEFEIAGFRHKRCAAPPATEQLEVRSNRTIHAGHLGAVQVCTFVDYVARAMYARLVRIDSSETCWYTMHPTRETLAKIVAAGGDGDQAAKL